MHTASRRFGRIAVLAALSGLSACAAEPPLSPEVRARSDRSARIGALLFVEETARARATEALAAAKPSGPAGASVTRLSPDGTATTSFVAAGIDPPQVAYEVVTPPDAASAVTRVDPARPLDADGAAMLRAEATARREVRIQCGDAYDAVVLPGALVEKEGWLVYLLAEFQKPNVRVLAGHQLVRVSADGRAVLEQVSLAEKCIVARDGLEPGAVVMLPRTTGDAPTEADYYVARACQVRLDLVFEDGRVWKVGPR